VSVRVPPTNTDPRAKIEGLSERGLRNLRRICLEWIDTHDDDAHGTRITCQDFIRVADRAVAELEAEKRRLMSPRSGMGA
jgi:hypothetical protein